VLTPTSIYAPGSPISPPDGDEGTGPKAPTRDGHPAGYQPGYRTAPGYGITPGYGAAPGYGTGRGRGDEPGSGAAIGHDAAADYGAAPGRSTGPGPHPGPEEHRPGHAAQRGYAGPGGAYGANPGYGVHPRHGRYGDADGYGDADEYGEQVNGGSYAYVIRDEEPAQAPPGTRAQARAPSPERQSRQDQRGRHNQHGHPPGQAGDQQTADPAVAYGPDDPAYGPPGPEWYAREDTGQQAVAEELRQVRGPFEPLDYSQRSGREIGEGAGGYPAASYLAASYEALGLAGTDDDLGGRGGALDQLKDFYAAAEAIGADHLDEHFRQLLERQRKLISEYFRDSAGQRDRR
jgi:hypothetical protein